MGFKQIKDSDRITFFNLFAKEILLSFCEKERVKLSIEVEKIRRNLVKPLNSSDEAFKLFLKNKAQQRRETNSPPVKIENFEPSNYQIETDEEIANKKRPINPRQNISENPENIRQLIRKKFIQPKQIENSQRIYPPHTPPQNSSVPGSGYKKIEVLLNDMTVQSIECPGPGKNLIVKRYNQTNITKFTLNPQDITDIINEFSKQARIPVMGGILKAAIGNIIISAIISEFVGSRFIITKSTPYSLIYDPNQ